MKTPEKQEPQTLDLEKSIKCVKTERAAKFAKQEVAWTSMSHQAAGI